MGEDCGSLYPQHHLDRQAPNLEFYASSQDFVQQKTLSLYSNSGNDMVNGNENLAAQKCSKVTQQNISQPKGACGWSYCLPRFRQFFTPATEFSREKLFSDPPKNSFRPAADIPREKVLTDLPLNWREPAMGNVGATNKKFLVFDHSHDQTTLILSSGIQTPAPCLTPWSLKLPSTSNVNFSVTGAEKEYNHLSIPVMTDDLEDYRKTDLQSEMREDTEELNALLYSDDESDTEDDEVTSTGHSPSAVTCNTNHDCYYGTAEEVNSSVGSTKKRKTLDSSYEYTAPPGDSSCSAKYRKIELEVDAESNCGNGKNLDLDKTESFGNKRMRMEKIRETVRILQKIIPDGEGKDATLVLDEAIIYLKSLKIKAKALGLSSH